MKDCYPFGLLATVELLSGARIGDATCEREEDAHLREVP